MQTKFDLGQRVFFEITGVGIIGTAEILAIDIRAPHGVRYNLNGVMYLEATVYSDPDTCANALAMREAAAFQERQSSILHRLNALKREFPVPSVVLGEFN